MNKGIDRRLLLLAGGGAAAAAAWRLSMGKAPALHTASLATNPAADAVSASSTGTTTAAPVAGGASAPAMPSLGVNLTPINYWTAVAFIDRLKASAGWDTHGIPAPVNSLGYPTGLGGQRMIATMLPCEPGTYLLSHNGDMDVRIQGGTLVARRRDGVVYEARGAMPTGRPLIIDAIRKPPTFMRLVNQKDAAAFAAGEVFAPEFLSQIKGFDTLRFMDWMRTNGSKVTDAFPAVDSCSYANGVPIEIMLALAKKIGARPWLCVPHLASDGLVARMIDALRAASTGGGPAGFLEYSNEVWNLGFEQARFAQQQAVARLGGGTAGDAFYGYRSGQIARLARGSGVRMLLGTQTVNPRRADAVWDGVRRAGASDGDFAGWIIATYVNGTLTDARGPTIALAARKDVAAAIDNLLNATGPGALSVATMKPIYKQQGDIARAHGLPLIAYEGNLHLNPIPTFAAQQALVKPFFEAITRSPASAAVMEANLAAFSAAGGNLACLYNLSSGPGNGGFFSLVDSGSWPFIEQQRAQQRPAA